MKYFHTATVFRWVTFLPQPLALITA